jgi:hypothetical protein
LLVKKATLTLITLDQPTSKKNNKMITLTTQTLQVDGSKNVNCLKIDNINQRKTLSITRQEAMV